MTALILPTSAISARPALRSAKRNAVDPVIPARYHPDPGKPLPRFSDDCWDFSAILTGEQGNVAQANFANIRIDWLRLAAKEVSWAKLNVEAGGRRRRCLSRGGP